MKQATELQLKHFIDYRNNHIGLVKRIGEIVFGEDFSKHDYDKCTCDVEDLNLFALRNAAINGEFKPTGDLKKVIGKLAGKHIKQNKHHPEFWDDSIKTETWNEEDKPQVNAKSMSKKAICEMACDWAAVAIKRNQPIFAWYNKEIACDDSRFLFTDNQKEYLKDCLVKIMGKVDEEHLYYPGITYNCKQIEPKLLEDIKGYMKKEDKDQILKFANIVADPKKSLHEELEDCKRELRESILDIPHKDYLEGLFDEEGRLSDEIRDQIMKVVDDWKQQINFDFNVIDVEAKGSLLSKRYNDTTDLDVSIITDMTEDQLKEVWDILPKGNNLIINNQQTSHPLDFYVLANDEHPDEVNMDNIYDVLNNEWIKRTEEYENEIPADYLISVCNFYINGCIIALQNYESDKVMFEYYKNLDPKTQQIKEDEKVEVLEVKKKDLKADLDAMRVALHMISSFRQEAYNGEESTPLRLSIEIESDNPHVTINEQCAKILEKFGIREKLRNAVKECASLIEDDISEEVVEEVKPEDTPLEEKILKKGNKWQVTDHTGKKNLGTYNTKDEAEKRLQQVEYFKHMNEDGEGGVGAVSASGSGLQAAAPEHMAKLVDPSGELLKEAKEHDTAALTFGRMNPMSKGHLKLANTLNEITNADKFIYLSHKQDPVTDPLPFWLKRQYVQVCLDENNLPITAVDTDNTKIVDILQDLYKQGYKNIIFVIGSDRFESMKFIEKYNNKFDEEGNGYNFDSIEFKSAGNRDADSDDLITSISASKLRQYVREGDFDKFYEGVAIRDRNIALEMFNDLKKYMNVK